MTGTYRPDLDGLRALAVASVILYHIGSPAGPAGFIGVDIFFVISGYLITAQLWVSRDKPFGRLLLDFYARRARRILPPLAIVVITILVLGKLFLFPDGEQQDLAKSGIASALLISNFFFWRRSVDYFAAPAELQPLLHTWSLAVEEQFYLLWPMLLAALWTLARHCSRRRAETGVLIGIASISLLSLALSIAWTAQYPGAAFFLMPSRFWELGSGAALAMIFTRPDAPKLPNFADLAGLAGIVAALFLYSRRTPFPGIAALLPVAGTALLIAAGAQRKTGLTHRLLASRPMTLTGEISYSWYLWHWPLLTLGRVLDLGRHDLARDTALVLLAYLLAYLSTRFVETPIRRKQVALFSAARASLLTGFCLLSLTASLSLALWISAAHDSRSGPDSAAPACENTGNEKDLASDGPCVLAQGERATVFLIGDSHAVNWSPAIATWAKAVGVRAIDRSLVSCPFFLAFRGSKDEVALAVYSEACAKYSQLVMTEIQQTAAAPKATAVILNEYWDDYIGIARPARRLLAARLEEALTLLERAGTKILIIGPTPTFDYAIPSCVARQGEHACRIARARHDTKTQAANAMLFEIVAKHPNARIWDPTSQYCDARYCYPTRDGKILFVDEDHLSIRGVEIAAPAFALELDWLLRQETEMPRQ